MRPACRLNTAWRCADRSDVGVLPPGDPTIGPIRPHVVRIGCEPVLDGSLRTARVDPGSVVVNGNRRAHGRGFLLPDARAEL